MVPDEPAPPDPDQVPVPPEQVAAADETEVVGQGPLIRPQPGAESTRLAYLLQHLDYPARIQAKLSLIDSSFDRGDYLFAIDMNAYWKLGEALDDVFDWIVTEIDPAKILLRKMPVLVSNYKEIEITAESHADEISEKRRFIGALMKRIGLTTKDKEDGFAAVPRNQMQDVFRFVSKDAVVTQREIEKYGILQVVADWKTHFIDVGLDIFCVVETPRNLYPYGCGKTSLAMEFCGAMAKVLGYPFDLRADIAYTIDLPRVRRFLEDNSKGVVRMVDEGKIVWGRRTAMVGQQKKDMMTLSTIRKNRQVWLVVVDNIFRLDLELYEAKATHLLRVQDEGHRAIPRGWNRAILYKKADYNEENDRWGRQVVPLKWEPLPAQISDAYHACVDYTNDHARMIIDEDMSPLDELLKADRTWNLDKLEGWLDGGILTGTETSQKET